MLQIVVQRSTLRTLSVAGILLIPACSDPKAVQTFAAMAPDPSVAQGLTQIYVAEPGWRALLHQGTNIPPDPNVSNLTTLRIEQAKAIISIDTGIREYMKALGALAADTIVQSSSNVDDLKTGLTAFQKAMPNLGITNSDVTLVSQFVQAVANLAETAYRDAKLAQLIGDNDAALQRILDIQSEIVSRAIIPSINDYPATIAARQRFINAQSETVYYLFERALTPDRQNATAQLAAAQAYVKALGDIKAAHSAFVQQSKQCVDQANV